MKKDFKFIDKSGTIFYVQVEIKEKDGEKCFSMSASYNGGFGQCYDSIQPANKHQKRLVEIWKEYHLNDMKAGTQRQEKLIKSYLESNGLEYSYDLACDILKSHKIVDGEIREITNLEYKQLRSFEGTLLYDVHPKTKEPYRYGSLWLTWSLPENFETELEGLINNLDRGDLEADAATQFLKDTETAITKKYVKNGPYFEGETEYRDIYRITLSRNGENYSFNFGQSIANQGKEPTNYDILACLEKYDYGSFEDFCNELGYDPYSKKSKKAYKACEDQYQKLAYMFDEDEMDKLRGIQ